MRLVLASGLIAVAAAFSAQPATAKSVPPPTTPIDRPQAKFTLYGPAGYSLVVEGKGRKVMLSVVRELPSLTFLVAGYAARGRVTPRRIRARFGRFGLVSVRLTKSRRTVHRPPPWCKGNPAIERRGTFTGRIRFRGEEDYVIVDERRARGHSVTFPRRRCRRGGPGRASSSRKPRPVELVELTASTPHKRVFLEAFGLKEGKETVPFGVLAMTAERRGSVRIARGALVLLPEGKRTLVVSGDAKTASLKPPRPFYGVGRYDADAPASERWTGALGVNLLGAKIPLTGRPFRARLEIKSFDEADAAVASRFGDLVPRWLPR